MQWSEICNAYPNQWLIIEALKAHTESDYRRRLDEIAVIGSCPDGSAAMQNYRRLHRLHPIRELYFVHTSRKKLDIREQQWLGIRRANAACSQV